MKRFFSVILSIVLSVSLTVTAFADLQVASADAVNGDLLQKIEFAYYSAADSTAICYYTNEYFAQSSYTYNPSLATMSMSLAFSAFGSSDGGEDDYSNKSSNVKDLLMKIGMKEENIDVNEGYITKPTTDSIGVVAGNMPIKLGGEDFTLVAIAVRGGGYEQEWASNFTLGTSSQHQGFSEAKTQVVEFLKTYFSRQNISGAVKLWITGYSRGAAVANLLGGSFDDGVIIDEDITYQLSDVFTYCFEAPAGALTDDLEGTSRYENIFNIINPNDPVPFVAPFDMGFSRYGVDIYLPTAETAPENYETLKSSMLEFYYGMEGITTYTVDDFQMKKLGMENWLPGGEPINFIVDDTKNNYSQNVFLSKYVTILSDEFFVTRENFVANYESEIREICSVIFGCTSEQQKILLDSFISQAQSNWGELAWSYVWNAGINPWGEEADALKIISEWLKTAINDAGITDYDEALIDSAGIALGDLMLALVLSHPNYFSTAVMNASGLMEAHYPELCFAWLQSLDSNYTDKDVEYTINKNAYRIVYIEGDADVNVFKADGTLIASIVDDAPVQINNSAYSFGIDEGLKYIILPIDNSYNIIMENDTESLVNYTVKEFNASFGFTRVVEFNSSLISEKDYLTGSIPSYSDEEIKSGAPLGSTVKYTLTSSVGTVVEIVHEVSRNHMFNVNAISSNEKYGYVSGGDVYRYGETAYLCAEAINGYIFKGWYENGKPVSNELIYGVEILENKNFVAMFGCAELTPIAGNGVSVSNGQVFGMWDELDIDSSKLLFEASEVLEANTEGYIGTGTLFTYFDLTYTVIILGDTDGDGEITATDYMRIKSAFLGKYTMDDVYEKAADVDGDGELSSTDYLRIKSHFLGKYTIYENKTV